MELDYFTQIHFQSNLETVLNVFYVFVLSVKSRAAFSDLFHDHTWKKKKKSLFWKMTNLPVEPHFPLVVCSIE